MIRKVLAASLRLGALAGAGVVLSASVGLAQPAEPDTKVRPGLWRYETKVSILGSKTENKCLKPEEIERFLFNPCNRHHVCTYPVKQIGNGHLHLEGQWVKKKGGSKFPVNADGTYTPTTINMTANVKILGGIPVSGVIKGTWVSDTCPAPAPAG